MPWFDTYTGTWGWAMSVIPSTEAAPLLRWLNHNRLTLAIRWALHQRKGGGWYRDNWEEYLRTYCVTPKEALMAFIPILRPKTP